MPSLHNYLYSYRDERLNLHLEFLWQPMVNESMVNVYKKWIEIGKKGNDWIILD